MKIDIQKANKKIETLKHENKKVFFYSIMIIDFWDKEPTSILQLRHYFSFIYLQLAILELERDDLLDKVGKMNISLQNLTVTSEKMEEQEQKTSSVTFENNKLTRQNQTLNRKLEETEIENKSLDSENQKLQKTIENLKSTARRVEQLEKENFELESSQHKLDR